MVGEPSDSRSAANLRRIWFVLPNFNGGGAETATLCYLDELRRLAIDCGVIVRSSDGALAGQFSATAPRIVSGMSRSRSRGRLRLVFEIGMALRQGRIDRSDKFIVMLSGVGVVAILRALRLRWVYVSIQNPIPDAKLARISIWLVDRLCTGFLVPAPGFVKHLQGYGIVESRIRLTPNPIRLPKVSGKPKRRDADFQVVTVARLEDQKRLDRALRAFAAARREGWRFRICGVGSRDAELRGLATDLGISDAVEFAGFIHDIEDEYRLADAFLITSDYEGFGNVIVEALMSGIPVVSADVEFGPRFILEGLAGCFLIRRDDLAAYSKALEEISLSPPDAAVRVQMVKRGLDFSPHVCANSLLQAVGWSSEIC